MGFPDVLVVTRLITTRGSRVKCSGPSLGGARARAGLGRLAGALGGAGWRDAPRAPRRNQRPAPRAPERPRTEGRVHHPAAVPRPLLALPGSVQVTTEQSLLDSLAEVPSEITATCSLLLRRGSRDDWPRPRPGSGPGVLASPTEVQHETTATSRRSCVVCCLARPAVRWQNNSYCMHPSTRPSLTREPRRRPIKSFVFCLCLFIVLLIHSTTDLLKR
jgi:hypothetical protein